MSASIIAPRDWLSRPVRLPLWASPPATAASSGSRTRASLASSSATSSWTGTLTAASKSAYVQHPDGSQRRLYCHETPEPYFEDVGRAQLINGHAQVRLDQDFAAIVRSDNYHVYLTPEADSKGLYVTAVSATGFEVREQQAGTSSLPFSYRIMARRKDMAGPRFERVQGTSQRRSADVEVPPQRPRPADPEQTDERSVPGRNRER